MSKDTKLIQTRILLGTSGCVLFYVATPEQYQVGPLQCFEALVPIAPAGPQQHFVASQWRLLGREQPVSTGQEKQDIFLSSVSLLEGLYLKHLSGMKHFEARWPVFPILLLLRKMWLSCDAKHLSSWKFIFPLLPLLISLAADFAEVFVHRLQNAQIFHQSGKSVFLRMHISVFLLGSFPPKPRPCHCCADCSAVSKDRSKLFQLPSWCEPDSSVAFNEWYNFAGENLRKQKQ